MSSEQAGILPEELSAARTYDAQDPLKSFREKFWIPERADGEPEVYFVGNSLGLQPKCTREFLEQELASWRERGVRGHFEGEFPWMPYHEFLTPAMAQIVGALESEVVVMNSLTCNLHLMLATFYRPDSKRNKILIEDHAFPSDYQAVSSQVSWHGLDPTECLIQITPEAGSELISTDAILGKIEELKHELAVVMLPGVQYYSGQVFDMKAITAKCHEHGIIAGFDLAHAAGNIELKLHDWDADFAVWCTYKYLNSGPGSIAGCFVNERHARNTELHRLAGWWGHDKSTRFLMKNEFSPIATAEGWQLSNPPILSLAAIRASMSVFEEVGWMQPLVNKSKRLTGFLEKMIKDHLQGAVEIITPADPAQRGCQLSLKVIDSGADGKEVYGQMEDLGFRTDWREPDGIRCAPVPLYNTFEDCWRFVMQLKRLLCC